MNDENAYLEDNIGRMIGAAFAAEVRPRRNASKQVLRRLVSELQTERPPPAFPNPTLALLVGILALMATVLATHAPGVTGAVGMNSPMTMVAVALALNLVWVPIAGTVIVIRRRRHVC